MLRLLRKLRNLTSSFEEGALFVDILAFLQLRADHGKTKTDMTNMKPSDPKGCVQ